MAKVLIVYDSRTGNTEKMAKHLLQDSSLKEGKHGCFGKV